MTDKEAIEYLEEIVELHKKGIPLSYTDGENDAIETILNLIQTQQEEIEKKDNIVRSIISRLNNDINNIAETKAKKSEHYLDDYTRCRLKAYKTKTREIKEYIEKEYFAEI